MSLHHVALYHGKLRCFLLATKYHFILYSTYCDWFVLIFGLQNLAWRGTSSCLQLMQKNLAS